MKIIEWYLDETNIAQPNIIFIFVIINYITFYVTLRGNVQCRRGVCTSLPITGIYIVLHALLQLSHFTAGILHLFHSKFVLK